MNGEYLPGEQQQELTIIMRFSVKHNPGNDQHLKMLAKNYLEPKGLKIIEENNILIIV